MNQDHQRRQIQRFLKGRIKKDIDTFCIYQWIERCHFHGWWELGVRLGSSIPPNSLPQEYHKRVDYLLSECRSKLKEQFVEIKSPKSAKSFTVPKSFWDVCQSLGIKPGGSSNHRLRLEYLWAKVVSIEKIKPEGCIFYFPNMERHKLIDWLDKNGFEHLKGSVMPKNESSRQKARLKITWEDATHLIPILFEDAKIIVDLVKSYNNLPLEKRKIIDELLGIVS